jgi:hypothetical protein
MGGVANSLIAVRRGKYYRAAPPIEHVRCERFPDWQISMNWTQPFKALTSSRAEQKRPAVRLRYVSDLVMAIALKHEEKPRRSFKPGS